MMVSAFAVLCAERLRVRMCVLLRRCLTAPGYGFGARIVDYMACGCIPVVVRPGRLLLPFEPDLDYDSFAVSVAFEELPHLPQMLAGLSERALRAKRDRMNEVHRMFLWDDSYGSAFAAVHAQILDKVRSVQ